MLMLSPSLIAVSRCDIAFSGLRELEKLRAAEIDRSTECCPFRPAALSVSCKAYLGS